MKSNRIKALLLGCVMIMALTAWSHGASPKNAGTPEIQNEKTMEDNIKKSIQLYDAALISYNENNLERAKKNIDKAVALDPGNPDAIDLKQKIAARLNESAPAAVSAEKSAPAVPAAENKAAAEKSLNLFAKAKEEYDNGNFQKAQKHLANARKHDPQLPGAEELNKRITAALAQERSSQNAVAAKETAAVPAVSTKQSRRSFVRAQKAYRNRNLPRAVAYCTAAISFDPSNTAAEQLQRRLQTLQARSEMIARDMVEGYIAKAAKCLSDQNPFEAAWWLNRAVRIAPDDASIEEMRQTAFREARNYRPEITSPRARRQIEAIARKFRKGDYLGAEQISRILQYDHPKTRPLVVMIQDHLLDQANDDRAEKEYKIALKQAMNGQFDNALVTVKGALFFNPQHFPARALLAQVEFELADTYFQAIY